MNTTLFLVCLKSLKLQTGTKIIFGNLIIFVRLFEIANALANFPQRIWLRNRNFLIKSPKIVIYFHVQHFHSRFSALFTKNSTWQVSVVGFKVSIVRLREVSVLLGV